MIFHPSNTVLTGERFVFAGRVDAVAHASLHTAILREFWHNFTYRSSTLQMSESEAFVFSIGTTEPLPLDGNAYSIHVTAEGICVSAENESDLRLGLMTLLDRIRAIDGEEGLACVLDGCQIWDRPLVKKRMVHFCIFPETELWELQRFVRLCGALKYTHVVLEFWGMLKFDCLKELAWQQAFSKEQIRPILEEARDLGLEIVPMFNHWGHASAGRVMHGKHVVLDQNPMLQTYFSEDGWCWDIRRPKVRALLRQIRNELMELCGEGEYFHIGCDEAFDFVFTEESMDFICDFINEISAELREKNRRVIAWGDMLLYRHATYNPKNRYTCFSPSAEAQRYMMERLTRDILIADWQYDAKEAPVETAKTFTDAGFECLLCPWDRGVSEMRAVISTVKETSLAGYLHTTWHTLTSGIHCVTLAAVGGFESIEKRESTETRISTAALLRKVMPSEGNYTRAGWSPIQVHCKW